jgi:hypothetical protein
MSKKMRKSESEALLGLESLETGEPAVEFEEWWSHRMNQIPTVHRKEILKADFRGRGLSEIETMSAFDAALEKYGIKLK